MSIFLALLGPLFYAVSILIDSHLSNNIFKNKFTLILFSASTNLLFVPLLFFIGMPGEITFLVFLALIGISLTEYGYMFPYYKALETSDSSKITSFFVLGKIFLPIFAYFTVGEQLNLLQYFGFFVIIFATLFLGIDKTSGKFKISLAIWLMFLASFLLTIQKILWKYVFLNVDLVTGIFWFYIIGFLLLIPVVFIPKITQDIKEGFGAFKKNIPFFLSNEAVMFLGGLCAYGAISLDDVSLVSGISGIQPIYVLLLGILGHKLFPGLFKEDISKKAILEKLFFYILIIFGIILLAGYSPWR